MFEEIHASQLSQLSKEQREQYVLVDVRTPEEYEQGHIPNTIHIPHDEMMSRHSELAEQKERDILLICRSGQRSAFAAQVLHHHGFRKLYNLVGGMLEWTGDVEK